MKKTVKYIYLSFAFISMSAITISCEKKAQETQQKAETFVIPELKERSSALAALEDWGKIKETISSLKGKIKTNPNDYTSMLIIAVTYMQEARTTGEHPYYYPAAMKIIDHVIQKTADNDGIHYKAMVAKCSIFLSQHQFKEALELGQKTLAMNNQQSEIYGVLCDAHVELGDYTEAVKMADMMNSIKPDLRSYARISYLREIFGDNIGATEAMNMAVSAGLAGTEAKAWARVTLGMIYEKMGQLDKALLEYKKAYTEYPDYAFAIDGEARIEASKKNYTKAIELCEKAEKIMPEFSFTKDKALYYQQKGDREKALALGNSVVTMLKEDQDSGHETALELSNLYAKVLGDYDKALAICEKEYAKRPKNIDV